MISKLAVKRFLQRRDDLRDLRRWKKRDVDTLEKIKDALPVHPPIWNKLRTPQKVCLLIGAKLKAAAFFLDTGSGKTLLSIALIRYLKKARLIKSTLVLVPYRTNCDEWKDEVELHSPATRIVILKGSSARKWELLEQDATIYVTTYAGMVRMLSTVVHDAKRKKNRLKLSAPLVRRFCSVFQAMILDESTEVQSHRSLPFRVCRQIAKRAEYRFLLTGTPFGRDPTPLWSQLFLVDQGETLGKTLGLFRAAFFSEKKNFWGGFEYTYKPAMKPVLHRMLAHSTIRYKADQAELPACVELVRKATLPKDAQSYYNEARTQLLAARGNIREQKNLFLRMRQISSGFVGYYDDDAGAKAQFKFDQNPKLEILTALLSSIDTQYKIIVFHDFVFSGMMIVDELRRLKIKYARIFGRVKDTSEQLRRFKKDESCRVLVMNTAGAFGLNLQIAKYGIFYESPVPVIERKQMERRYQRQYSPHKTVFQYDLIVKGTYDEKIRKYHKEGADLFKGIIEGDA